MKVTVYTISDCQFSKQEKEYLNSKGIQYEEKNLELNKDFLTEMLTISNNFAGTPVTKVEKDDGHIEVLKGFTKEEFDRVLGIGAVPDAGQPMAQQPTTDMNQPQQQNQFAQQAPQAPQTDPFAQQQPMGQPPAMPQQQDQFAQQAPQAPQQDMGAQPPIIEETPPSAMPPQQDMGMPQPGMDQTQQPMGQPPAMPQQPQDPFAQQAPQAPQADPFAQQQPMGQPPATPQQPQDPFAQQPPQAPQQDMGSQPPMNQQPGMPPQQAPQAPQPDPMNSLLNNLQQKSADPQGNPTASQQG